MFGVVGRGPIEHDAGADPVGTQAGLKATHVAQDGCTVAQSALTRQVLRDALKDGELLRNACITIRIAEVSEQRDFFHLGQHVEPRPGGAKLRGGKPQAVHAAVEFEEDAVRHMGLVRGQHIDLRIAVHGVPQV